MKIYIYCSMFETANPDSVVKLFRPFALKFEFDKSVVTSCLRGLEGELAPPLSFPATILKYIELYHAPSDSRATDFKPLFPRNQRARAPQ